MCACVFEPGLHRATGAQIQRMSNDGDDPLVGEICRSVNRPVVDNDDFAHRESLLQDGFERGADDIDVIPGVDLDENPHCRSALQSIETISTTKRKEDESCSAWLPRCGRVCNHR